MQGGEREKERTRASGRHAREKGEREKERANESENERREHSREGPRKRRRGRAPPAQQRQQWGLRHNSGSSGDFVGVDWIAGATPQARRVSTLWMYLDCGPQRDGAGELLPSPALFAEEAVGVVVGQDITERKVAKQEKARVTKELQKRKD